MGVQRRQRFERTALRIASGSGNCPVASLEWIFLPLTVTSNAPPPEGMNVSDLTSCLSRNSFSARPTA